MSPPSHLPAGSRMLRPGKKWSKHHNRTGVRKLDVRNYPQSKCHKRCCAGLLGIIYIYRRYALARKCLFTKKKEKTPLTHR